METHVLQALTRATGGKVFENKVKDLTGASGWRR
jgi:hypothetical protein